MKLFLLLFILLMFIPIPIKFDISYSNKNYYIKIYNINISNKLNFKKSNNNKKEKPSKKNSFSKKITPQILLKAFNNNKFKPFLYLKGDFSYSFNDSAITAITYGLLSSLFPLLYKAINILFKICKFSLPIKPLFKNELLVNFKIKSIIFFSLAQIIYIFFLILKQIIYEEEADPLG